jgi:succinoglycan biosynthesis protein ExoA
MVYPVGTELMNRAAVESVVSASISPASVSVVIPCHNEREFIEQLLDAVRAQDLPPLETIVVDNASSDGSDVIVEAYAARHPSFPLRLLRCWNPGAAAAMNVGIRASIGQIIVRLDGHSRPNPDYVRRAVQRLAEPQAGVVGGVWEIIPGARTLRARAIAVAVASKLGSGGAAYRHGDSHTESFDVDTVPFGCFRRDLWTLLDGFDDSLLVVEDGEFNYRVRRSGRRVILDPAIRCTYYPRRRLRTLGRQYFRYGWWKIPMLMRHPGAVRLRQLVPLAFVAAVISLSVAGLFYSPAWSVLAGLLIVYAMAVSGSAVQAAYKAGDLRLAMPLTCAYTIIHFMWGAGGLLHLVTLGRWPPWRLPLGTRIA